ncbi:hypothetical protein SO802_008691 [Lithocarpus litseifolius]|uniref:Nudix hydrolase domain-containing protein n=1 Tax=Lithocarpus litseifolius TaxID=425828 RepID=A0AAW2DAQ8_9ROSI
MCDLVARTGRHQQRYDAGCRLVAGFMSCVGVVVEVGLGNLDFGFVGMLAERDRRRMRNLLVCGTMDKVIMGCDLELGKGWIIFERDHASLPGQLNYWRNAWRPVAVDMSTYVNTLASVIVCCRTIFWEGGWENDETVQEAAVREAIEEAGVRGELMVLKLI